MLIFVSHVNDIARACNFHTRALHHIRRFVPSGKHYRLQYRRHAHWLLQFAAIPLAASEKLQYFQGCHVMRQGTSTQWASLFEVLDTSVHSNMHTSLVWLWSSQITGIENQHGESIIFVCCSIHLEWTFTISSWCAFHRCIQVASQDASDPSNFL